MSRILFISDLHLDATRPAVRRALGDFLSLNQDCDALYILGDLFEAWPGDDENSTLASEITTLLKDFSSSGPGLFIMQGNRDFLLGEVFCRRVGATLLPDPSVIDLYGQRTLLMHGDSLCTQDHDYQAFRRMSRDPLWQARLLSQSLGQRRALAAQLRQMSREAKSNKAGDIMDVTPAEVDLALRGHSAVQLIHGHTHRPARHEHRSGLRWVLGDWTDHAWVLEAKAASISLTKIII